MKKFNLTVEEFVSLYNGASRGIDYDHCCNLIEQIFDMNGVMTLTLAECLLQFRKYVNENKPDLKAVMDQLNSEFTIPKSSKDPNYQSTVEAYISKAKDLLKGKTIEVEHIDYKADLHVSR